MVITKRGLVLGVTVTLTTVTFISAGIHSQGQAFGVKGIVDEVCRLLTANTWMARLTRWIGGLCARVPDRSLQGGRL